jgi:hypothetical protein
LLGNVRGYQFKDGCVLDLVGEIDEKGIRKISSLGSYYAALRRNGIRKLFSREGRRMKSSPALDSVGRALIELEYAAADFGHWKALITDDPSDFSDLESLLSKLTKATNAVQIAVEALKRRLSNDASLNAT